MKSLSTASINQACQRYINLKSDKEYKSYYKAFTALNLLAQNPRFEAGSVYASLKSHILDKWDLKHVISPYLKIRLDGNLDITSKSVQLILGAFGLIEDTSYIYNFFTSKEERKWDNLSKDKLKVGKRYLRTLGYMMHINLKMKVKQAGRFLGVHHSTVSKWVEEFQDLPKAEQDARIDELKSGKPIPSYDLSDEKNRYNRSQKPVETLEGTKETIEIEEDLADEYKDLENEYKELHRENLLLKERVAALNHENSKLKGALARPDKQ